MTNLTLPPDRIDVRLVRPEGEPEVRWRFTRLCSAFKAGIGDVLIYRPGRPAGERFTVERHAVGLHEGNADKLVLDGALVPLDRRTVEETRTAMRDQVIADVFAADPSR